MSSGPLPPWGIPKRVALWLALGVVLAHLVALDVVGKAAVVSRTVFTKPFVTRTVALSRTDDNVPAAAPQAVSSPRAPVRPKPPRQPVDSTATSAASASQMVSVPVEPEPVKAEPQPQEIDVAQASPPTLPASAPAPATGVQAVDTAAPVAPVASSVPVTEVALALPGSMRLKYSAEGLKDNLTYRARAEILWQHDGSQYEARMEVSAFLVGARVRTSSGKIGPAGLLPDRFSDKFRSEQAAHFERGKNKVSFSANTPDAPLLAGLQDQLSVLFQLASMLGGSTAKYPPGTDIAFETIGPRSPETWVIRVVGEEMLNLPGGQARSLKLTRLPRRDYDQTTDLWLAPEFGYLPVRIKITDKNGDFVDQQWRASEPP